MPLEENQFIRLNRMLCLAAISGDIHMVQLCITTGANIHCYNDRTLQNAVSSGHAEVVSYLAHMGANVHVDGDKLLLLCCLCKTKDNVEVLQILIDCGINVRTSYHTALMYCYELKHQASAALLGALVC